MSSDDELLELLGRDAVERELGSDPVWAEWLPQAWSDALSRLRKHGDFERFCQAVRRIPRGHAEESGTLDDVPLAQLNAAEDLRAPARVDASRSTEPLAPFDSAGLPSAQLDNPGVPTARLSGSVDFTQLEAALLDLLPWRKGPFRFRSDAAPQASDTHNNSLTLDTEWRSNLKWDRVLELAPRFDEARVLDVGSGNGYYLLRLLEAGARLAWGIEPSVLYSSQFLALSRAFAPRGAALLTAPVEELSAARLPGVFDVVMSMGVLYHRRDAVAHLRELRDLTRSGGQLIVETLVVDGPRGHVLTPHGRYAQMRNVFSIPSVLTLEDWLVQLGCRNVRSGAVVVTSLDEQRSTRFMPHPSLDSFLEPLAPQSQGANESGSRTTEALGVAPRTFTDVPSVQTGFGNRLQLGSTARRTIEGHPAPARVVVVADVK